ncbi:MAG: EAL domain-containing protein, partial [Alphaproteobacteria bacterium]|nr:EAL domain-containing protein [Alphaproteobacteria bacterium]
RTFEDALTTNPLRGPPLMLSVNLSTEHLRDAAIVERVEALLNEGRGILSRLQFEITETLLIKNQEEAEDVLNRLKALGVSVALDDFGTGYSSLVYLHRFPIDCVKIDQSFSVAILHSQRSRAIVRSIIILAQSMNLRTIAEGIEEKGVADALLALGCQYGQGRYFGKPTPASGLVDVIKAARQR